LAYADGKKKGKLINLTQRIGKREKITKGTEREDLELMIHYKRKTRKKKFGNN